MAAMWRWAARRGVGGGPVIEEADDGLAGVADDAGGGVQRDHGLDGRAPGLDLAVWDFAGRGPSGTRPARGEGHDRHITALAWESGGDRMVTGVRMVAWSSGRLPRARAASCLP
jgi:hypothetical protein